MDYPMSMHPPSIESILQIISGFGLNTLIRFYNGYKTGKILLNKSLYTDFFTNDEINILEHIFEVLNYDIEVSKSQGTMEFFNIRFNISIEKAESFKYALAHKTKLIIKNNK